MMELLRPVVLAVAAMMILATTSSFATSAQAVEGGVAQQGNPKLGEISTLRSIKHYNRRLMALGLSEQEAQTLVLRRLMDTFAPKPVIDDYWLRGAEQAAITNVNGLAEQIRHVRAVLTSLYGQQVETSAALKSIFRPMQQEAGFLSSEDQIAMSEFRAELFTSQIQRLNRMQMAEPAEARELISQAPPDPTTVLSDLAAFEYRLRQSSLANALRASGIEFSRALFRKTFKILQQYSNTTGPVLASLAETQRHDKALSELLGDSNALRIRAQLDPSFMDLQRTAEQLSLSSVEIFGVYEILSNINLSVREAFEGNISDRSMAMQAAREAAVQGQQTLIAYLGEEKANAIQASLKRTERNAIATQMQGLNSQLRPLQ